MFDWLFSFGSVATVITVGVIWLVVMIFLAMSYRTVVATNEVHIVQSGRKTTSYGKDQAAGNIYYAWPSWVPRIGIKIIELPVSVFDIQLNEYAAYDKGRVPFVIDILAFFRIEDSNVAAQRVSSFKELEGQLRGILQGASRSILAQSPIEEILEERAKYGQMFTDATDTQLKAWGVVNVKNIELMDIRDADRSQVIQRIMAVKQSLVESDSRIAVAKNQQTAATAEIEAKQTVSVRQQEADEQVGIRTAQKEQQIGIAAQKAQQAVKAEEKGTADKSMDVLRVSEVRKAEILREVQVVQADQQKQVTVKVAEGTRDAAKLHAEAVEVEGKAKGEAEKAVLLAPVGAQITLAEKIAAMPAYQAYLISIRQIDANQAVGIEQAKALEKAEVRVITTSSSPAEGMKSVMDLFTPKGALQVGAAMEALRSTEVGAALVNKVTGANGHVEDKHEE